MSLCRRLSCGVVMVLVLIGSLPQGQAGERGKSVPLKTLVGQLTSDNVRVREQAEHALDARSRAFLETLGKFEPEVLSAQSRFRDEARPLAPILLKLLDNHDDDCRASAALLLGTLGAEAANARPALLKIVRAGQEEAPGVWIAAGLALPHICPPDQPIGPDFLQALASIAGQQTEELEKSRAPGEKSRGPEADPIAYTSGFLGMIVGKTLIDSGRAPVELPTLIEMTGARYPRLLRASAISALQILQREALAAAPTLWTHLQDKDPLIQRASAGALLCVFNDATLVPTIVSRSKMSKEEKEEFRKSALEFLEEQAQRRQRVLESSFLTQSVVRDALAMLVHGNSVYRRYALLMLADLCPGPHEMAKSLVPATAGVCRALASRATVSLPRLPRVCGALPGLTQIPVLLPVEMSLTEIASKSETRATAAPIRSANRENLPKR